MSRLRGLLTPFLVLAATASTAPALAVIAPAGASGSRAEAGTDAASLEARTVPSARSVTPLGFYWQLTAPQPVVPGGFLLARSQARHASEGTRSDREFFTISSTGDNDVPSAALAAYKRAADSMATTDPGCAISWTFLAAIGRVESNHGRFGGAQLGSDGVSRPAILGPRLDGAGPFAAITDSDQGRLDGDTVWDRAVGQMQFLPSTWASVARDGDGDGVKNPDDIDDSALGSAVYLCGAGGSLANPEGMARAAFRYNHSDYYVQLVLSFAAGYQTGVFALPSPPPPADEEAATLRATARAEKAAKAAEANAATKAVKPTKHVPTSGQPTPTTAPSTKPSPTATPTPKPSPKPGPKPSPQPTPKPAPSPSPTPVVGDFAGTLRQAGDGYTLDGVTLDLGAGRLSQAATSDFDQDGTVETNRAELDGLLQSTGPVTVHGSQLGGVITVDGLAGLPY
jgi:membrane-bound lytic murein transglycosylase B